jgi:hypothetical protein
MGGGKGGMGGGMGGGRGCGRGGGLCGFGGGFLCGVGAAASCAAFGYGYGYGIVGNGEMDGRGSSMGGRGGANPVAETKHTAEFRGAEGEGMSKEAHEIDTARPERSKMMASQLKMQQMQAARDIWVNRALLAEGRCDEFRRKISALRAKRELATERRARVRTARLLERLLNLRATIAGLKYIGDVDQPEHKHGGFHDYAILTARSALRQIERLRSRPNALAEARKERT